MADKHTYPWLPTAAAARHLGISSQNLANLAKGGALDNRHYRPQFPGSKRKGRIWHVERIELVIGRWGNG